jgi:hypothetical protein
MWKTTGNEDIQYYNEKNGGKKVILAGSSCWKQPAHGYWDFQNPKSILQNLPENSSHLNALADSRLWILRINVDPNGTLAERDAGDR